ncbi:MAG: hypothetical protein FJW27_16175 [Acidimicrobiia bacterium]|nr:hypothetical protein [Acidimicrobiia bacterium]
MPNPVADSNCATVLSTRCAAAFLVMVAWLLAPVPVRTQSSPKAGAIPRKLDGRPDLQGYWTTQTFTPLQRPDRYANQPFLTDEEAARLTALLSQPNVDPLRGGIFAAADHDRESNVEQADPTHYDNAQWLTTSRPKTLTSRRTSLIVDPPNGRFPPLTEEGQKRAAARRAAVNFDSYAGRPLQERCIVWTHEGPPMMPPPYNDVTQILQSAGYVTIVRELATNLPRLIPTDGRPSAAASIRQWGGISRGRWEGDTLVVETTNFSEKTAFQGATESLRVVERFTRVSADRIDYTFTVSDPATWTAPWTVELPMIRSEGPLHEYACHEGNYGLVNILRGARAADQKRAK